VFSNSAFGHAFFGREQDYFSHYFRTLVYV
jgi:hypothetical protein